ncbi:MAG: serine/threonine protein kinase [Psychroserpens sp.]|jgi:serine/threonine protein kinase
MHKNSENDQILNSKKLLKELTIKLNETLNSFQDDQRGLLIFYRRATTYFIYADLCKEFLNLIMDVISNVYDDNKKLYSLKKKEFIKGYRYKLKIKDYSDDSLKAINPLIHNFSILDLKKKIDLLVNTELSKGEIVDVLFKEIQNENETIYQDIERWVDINIEQNSNFSRPQGLLPKCVADRDMQQLFNIKVGDTSNSKKMMSDYASNSFYLIKDSLLDSQNELKKSLNQATLEKIHAFYYKIVPCNLVVIKKETKKEELNKTKKNANYQKLKIEKELNYKKLMLIADEMILAYCQVNDHNYFEVKHKDIFEKIFKIKPLSIEELVNVIKKDNSPKVKDEHRGQDDVLNNKKRNQFGNKELKEGLKRKLNTNLYEAHFEQFVDLVTKYKNESFKDSPVKGYLMYIDQINFLGKTRRHADVIPTRIDSFHKDNIDESGNELADLITTDAKYKLPLFFKQKWGECIDQIFAVLLIDSNKVKPYVHKEIKSLITKFTSKLSTSKNDFFTELEQQVNTLIKEKILIDSNESEDSSLYEMLRLLRSWSAYNQDQDVQNEICARVILRLLINNELDRGLDGNIQQVIAYALKLEISCLIQEFFSGFMIDNINNGSQQDLNEKIVSEWYKYQNENISAFSVLLLFLIEQGQYTPNKDLLDEFIDSRFKKFITHKNRPSTCSNLVFKRTRFLRDVWVLENGKTEETIEEVEDEINDLNKDSSGYEKGDKLENTQKSQFINQKLLEGIDENINEVFLSKYTNQVAIYTRSAGEIDLKVNKEQCCFEFNKTTRQTLRDNNIEVERFSELITPERLKSIWNNLFSIESSKVVAYRYRNYLFDSCFYQTSKVTRAIFKNKITSSNLKQHFSKITKESFKGFSFNYSHLFDDKLNQKNKLLSQISSFGDGHRYLIQVGDVLGQGSFGVVFAAKDTLLDSNVAIKLIPQWFKSKEVSRQLIHEAIIMRRCEHPNVTTVYGLMKLHPKNFQFKIERGDVFDDNEFVYGLEMELVENGQTLKDFIESDKWKNLNFRERLDLFIDICEGVNKIHELEIVHGDLKPENVLVKIVDELPKVKITDFGLSNKIGQSSSSNSNKAFSSINVLEGGVLSKDDDIYSLGMILLYMAHPTIIKLFDELDLQHSVFEKYELQFFLNGVFNHEELLNNITFAETTQSFWGNANEYKYLLQLYDFGGGFLPVEEPEKTVEYFFNIISNSLSSGQTLTLEKLKSLIYSISNKKIKDDELENSYHYLTKAYSQPNHVSVLGLIHNISTLKEGHLDPQESVHNIKTPTYLGRIITSFNMNKLSEVVNLSELILAINNIQTFNNAREGHFSILWINRSFLFVNVNVLWLVQGKLYLTVINNLDEYFFDVNKLNKSEWDEKEFSVKEGALYTAISGIEQSEYFDEHYFFQLTDNLTFLPNEKPLVGRTVREHLRKIHKIYQEVKKSFLQIEFLPENQKVQEEHFIEELESLNESIDDFDDPFSGVIGHENNSDIINDNKISANGLCTQKYQGSYIDFCREVKSNDFLSELDDSFLMDSINKYVNGDDIKSFATFYDNCFDYSILKQLVINWKKSDKNNTVDNYMSNKEWVNEQKNSIEYTLYKMCKDFDYSEDLTIVSR